jgi:protein-S-isoprenylcysteine O-methyltransferase Ste14
MTSATVPAIGLALGALTCIGLLPRLFFRRGRLNLQWWLNSVPFWVAGVSLLGTLAGVVSPVALPAGVLAIAALLSLVLNTLALSLLGWTLATHQQPLSLWHQADDEAAHLVMEGPYASVRHPFYSSFLMTLAACALAAPHWSTLAALAYGAHRLAATAAKEEARFRRSAFGDRYAEYARRTGRFVPRLGARPRHVSTAS